MKSFILAVGIGLTFVAIGLIPTRVVAAEEECETTEACYQPCIWKCAYKVDCPGDDPIYVRFQHSLCSG